MAALELAQYFIKTGPRQVTHRSLTRTHAHTHAVDILFFVHAQVVELHLEKLWGYTIEEESTDCEPAPTPSHRYRARYLRLSVHAPFLWDFLFFSFILKPAF